MLIRHANLPHEMIQVAGNPGAQRVTAVTEFHHAVTGIKAVE
jgi:hypothetical protein